MNYTKELSLNEGQVLKGKNYTKEEKFNKILNKIIEHKIITTIVFLTLGFIICDIMLISSFVNVLINI